MRTIAKESEVQSAVLELLAYHRIWAMRINTAAQVITDEHGNKRFLQSHNAGRGVADVLALVEQQGDDCEFMPLWIECKNSIGRQSPEQITFQQDVERRGHKYIVARSIDDVLKALKEIQL